MPLYRSSLSSLTSLWLPLVTTAAAKPTTQAHSRCSKADGLPPPIRRGHIFVSALYYQSNFTNFILGCQYLIRQIHKFFLFFCVFFGLIFQGWNCLIKKADSGQCGRFSTDALVPLPLTKGRSGQYLGQKFAITGKIRVL